MTNQYVNMSKIRLYEKEYPDKDELVIAKVSKIEDFGAYVTLVEYGNIGGLINSGQISRKRIRSVHKFLRINNEYVMQVLYIDKQKGYVDLTKKHVDDEQTKIALERYTKSKTVNSILKNVSIKTSTDLFLLLERISWPLHKKCNQLNDEDSDKIHHPLDYLLEMDVDILNSYNIEDKVKECLLTELQLRLADNISTVEALVDLTFHTPIGILGIKSALIAGKKYCEEKNIKFQINLYNTPTYRLLMCSTEKNKIIDNMNDVIKVIEVDALNNQGNFFIKQQPKLI